ncbi:MAG: urea ABC transporter ATP-binding protein UrtD, partial [Cyanobacteria bacterium P01_D01_bin.71]
ELGNLLAKNIPLEELVPQLTSEAQREQALMLSYEVISANQINEVEAAVYQKLVSLLNLPPETVSRLETAALEDLKS